MQIKSISIRNVRGIHAMTFSPEKLTFLTGPSGSGKTSVMDAIRYIITGQKANDHITTGAPYASVSADFEKIGLLERSVDTDGKTKVRLNHKTTTAKSVTQQFDSVFGVSAASTSLLTSSELVAHSLGKDLAEYLLNGNFLKNDMTFKRLLALNPLDPDVADELQHMLPAEPEVITLQDIETVYQHYRASRPVLKKMIAEESVKAKFEGPEPTRKSSAIQSEITSVQIKIAKENQLALDYPKKKKELEELKHNIEETEKKLASYSGLKVVTTREKKAVAESKTNAQNAVNEVTLSINTMRKDIETLKNTLNALDTSVCPISKALICTTDKSPVKFELEETIALKQDSIPTMQARLAQYQSDLEKANQAYEDIIRRENDLRIRATLSEQLAALKSVKISVPDAPDPTVLSDLQSQLANLREELRIAQSYESAMEHGIRENALIDNYRIADILVGELAPSGGIRKKILSHSIGPLEDWCNEQMKTVIPKYKLRFDTNDNFAVTLVNDRNESIGFESISNGEQLRVVFIIMAMLNELNGVRIALIDNINALDVNAFKEFVKLISDVEASFDHIFISGIDNPGFVDIINASTIPHMVISCK